MSGGVDSSVAAYLLKKEGHDVFGLFMKNWDDENDPNCPAAEDSEDAAKVCSMLGIPFYAVEFVDEYRNNVFDTCLQEFKKGRTPNPDILCNSEIKFDRFLTKALEYGADALATGHYARIGLDNNNVPTLLKGIDPSKDQSYFLHAIDRRALRNVIFPIGGLYKSEIRKIASEIGLPVAQKKDSTGICFIGERKFKPFLNQFIAYQTGKFKTLDGETVGEHQGCAFYTLGQRRGLGLGGPGSRWFVVKKDLDANVVFVERGDDHAALFTEDLETETINWLSDSIPEKPFDCQAKVRYRQEDQFCTVFPPADHRRARVVFHKKQRAVTPGQSIVFYDGEQCLGGGLIGSVGLSDWERQQISDSSYSFGSFARTKQIESLRSGFSH